MSPIVLTIGHSNHSLTQLKQLLAGNGVTAVADVRSAPYSRLHPDFNREFLQKALREDAIQYVFMGQELGARPDDPSCYEAGRVQYRRLAERKQFKEGLRRVLEGARRYRIALLCAEKEPLACHRSLLVARELERSGTKVVHIHPDGELEPHSAAMERLLAIFRLEQADMFRTKQEVIDDACARQEHRIAYVSEDPRQVIEGI